MKTILHTLPATFIKRAAIVYLGSQSWLHLFRMFNNIPVETLSLFW